MSPQINIWEAGGHWQLCIWAPRPHVMDWKDDGVLPRLVQSEREYFTRERKRFDTMAELLDYLRGFMEGFTPPPAARGGGGTLA